MDYKQQLIKLIEGSLSFKRDERRYQSAWKKKNNFEGPEPDKNSQAGKRATAVFGKKRFRGDQARKRGESEREGGSSELTYNSRSLIKSRRDAHSKNRSIKTKLSKKLSSRKTNFSGLAPKIRGSKNPYISGPKGKLK